MLEVCVDTIEGALAAHQGGAARVELCSALSEGGLTPSAGMMREAAKLPIPSYAMIRPRCGLFHFTSQEINIMLSDILTARDAGLAGVVLGVQAEDGALDVETLKRLVHAAGPIGKTLHRVVDVVPQPLHAVDQAVNLGFDRILTSGAEPFAPDGVGLIRQMVARSAGKLSIMPGCGLTPENVSTVLRATGAKEAHASCAHKVPHAPAFSDFDPPGGRSETSSEAVRQMVSAIGLA